MIPKDFAEQFIDAYASINARVEELFKLLVLARLGDNKPYVDSWLVEGDQIQISWYDPRDGSGGMNMIPASYLWDNAAVTAAVEQIEAERKQKAEEVRIIAERRAAAAAKRAEAAAQEAQELAEFRAWKQEKAGGA